MSTVGIAAEVTSGDWCSMCECAFLRSGGCDDMSRRQHSQKASGTSNEKPSGTLEVIKRVLRPLRWGCKGMIKR